MRSASFIVLLSIRSAYAYRLTATEPFEVPASLFAHIAPGPCSYSLLTSVSSLECRELILNSEFRPVPAPVLRAFLADVGIADIDAGFYFRLLL